MISLVCSKFIKSQGYWFNIVMLDSSNKYAIQNTMRKQNQTDRDGLPFLLANDFDSLEEAKKYLDSLE